MNLAKLWEAIGSFVNQQIEAALARHSPHRIGVVTSYDQNTHSVKMTVQPEGFETGFVPIGTGHIGNGWGLAVGAQIGDQFVLGFVGGDLEVPFIAGRLFSDHETPPQVQSGEMLLQHQTGSKVYLDHSGNVTQVANQAHTMQVGKGMGITTGQAFTVTAGEPMTLTGGGNLA